MKPRFAELFAGAGGLTMGLERAGWESVWHAEIADAPRAILAYHWPSVPLLGDVTTLDGKALTALHGPIDLLCGGSPCQDLSVAGKRAGLGVGDLYKCGGCSHSANEQAHRTACPACGANDYENVMIRPKIGPNAGKMFDMMLVEPAWVENDEGDERTRSSLFFEQMRLWDETGADLCLWENVDGARSSNSGQDFGEVLRAFVGAAVPVPSDGWRSAGVAAGPRGVAAWRVLDAQYFGVPQRRRRIFVLGTRTGTVDPAQVLSLAESLRGDTPTRGEAGEGVAAGPPSGAGIPFAWNEEVITSPTHRGGVTRERTSALTPAGRMAIAFDALNQSIDSVAHSLRASQKMDGASWGGVIAFGAQNSAAQGASASAKCTPSLDRSKVPAVLAYAFGSHAGSNGEATNESHDSGGPVGFGLTEELTPALRAGRTQAICATGEVTHALTHEGADASEDGTGRGTPIIANTICAREAKGWNPARDIGNGTVTAGIPRRLTPRECERLMGWEDDHTLVPDAKGKLLSDAARYKACGNGVASPVAHWIGERLAAALAESQPNPSSPSAVTNSSRGASLDGPEGPELLAVIRSSTREVVVVRRGDLPVIEAGALYASRPSTPRTDS